MKQSKLSAAIRFMAIAATIFFALEIAGIGATWGAGIARAETPVTTGPTELKTLLAHLQRHYQETHSFTGKFTEAITRAGMPARIRAGTIAYSRPGRIRLEFGPPQPETIVSDGAVFHDYDPGLNQVMETPVRNAIKTQGAAAFLLGVGNVERDFTASIPPNAVSDGLSHVVLTPKEGGDKIEIGIDPATLNIEKLKIADALGNTTVFAFTGLSLNEMIAPEQFVFMTPAGADIVRSGGMK
jgi:outer membrane lipoprotein carrier protein